MDEEIRYTMFPEKRREPVKRVIIGGVMLICLVVTVFMFVAIARLERTETVESDMLHAQAALYEKEINQIYEEIRTPLAAAQNPYKVPTLLLAFLTEEKEKVPGIGSFSPILVTKMPVSGVSSIAWNGMWKNTAAILGDTADNDARREQLAANGFRILIRSGSKVQAGYADGITTLPYLLVDQENYDMASQLNKMMNNPTCVVFLFDVDRLSSEKLLQLVTQIQVAADAGNVALSTLSEQEGVLQNAYNKRQRQIEEDAANRQAQQERLRELQEKIREVYRGETG